MSAVSDPATAPVLAVHAFDLAKSFGRVKALRRIDLDVKPGTWLTLLGPNGSGKTTLLRVLAGLCRPTAGGCAILGHRPADRDVRGRIGVLLHQPHLYEDLTVQENLEFFAKMFGVARAAEVSADAARQVGLGAKVKSTVRTLSRGQQQRAALARTLLHDPELLLLDEPDDGLDTEAHSILMELRSRRQGSPRTVIMTSHSLELGLALSDEIAVIAQGRIAAREAASSIESVTAWYHEACGASVAVRTV